MTNRSVMLVMLVMVVVETRPLRTKREQTFCSAREIRQMLAYVCNIARRSVHSQGPTDTSPAQAPVWPSPSAHNRPNIHKFLLRTENRDMLNRKRASSPSSAAAAAVGGTPSRRRRNGEASFAFGDVQTNLILIYRGGQASHINGDLNERANVDKRDGDSGENQTIGDLRAKCCFQECTEDDFLGACS